MDDSKIESLKKLTLGNNEIIHIAVKENCTNEEMSVFSNVLQTEFPNLDGKWIITKDNCKFTKMNLEEISALIRKLVELRKNYFMEGVLTNEF